MYLLSIADSPLGLKLAFWGFLMAIRDRDSRGAIKSHAEEMKVVYTFFRHASREYAVFNI